MKTIQLKISVKAHDCYIYGGYIFFVMQDGRIVYGSYERFINRAIKKIEGATDLLKVAFLRNEHYYSKQIKSFLKMIDNFRLRYQMIQDSNYLLFVGLFLH